MDEVTKSMEDATKKIKWNSIILPASILIAGVFIGGAVIYTNKSSAPVAGTVGGVTKSVEFKKCLDSGKYANKVKESFNEGVALGVGGTPTAYFNGRQLQGRTITEIEQMIEEELGNVPVSDAKAERKTINTAGLPVLGSPDAEVTLVAFSDFQCPYCKLFKENVVDAIKEKYIKTGLVKFVFKDFPLSQIHMNAQKAAEATHCAEDQGKYWDYHDMIFDRQAELSKEALVTFAEELGLK
jgi:protein-disulfide isomerase